MASVPIEQAMGGYQMGCYTLNETRKLVGLPPVVEGDVVAPWWVPVPSDNDVAVFPGRAFQLIDSLRPFAYGLGFLLLLWGCMAWEKWIGWVMLKW